MFFVQKILEFNCYRELFKKKLKDLKGAILHHLCILFCVLHNRTRSTNRLFDSCALTQMYCT